MFYEYQGLSTDLDEVYNRRFFKRKQDAEYQLLQQTLFGETK